METPKQKLIEALENSAIPFKLNERGDIVLVSVKPSYNAREVRFEYDQDERLGQCFVEQW